MVVSSSHRELATTEGGSSHRELATAEGEEAEALDPTLRTADIARTVAGIPATVA